MKKTSTLFLSILIFILLAFPALAESTFTGGKMTVSMPDGWKANYDAKLNQIILTTKDEDCAIGIQIVDNGGKSEKEFATLLAKELKAAPPQKVDGADNYYLTAKIDNMDATFSFLTSGKKTLVFMEAGNAEKYDNEIQRIWANIKSSDPAEQAIFENS